MEFKGSREQLAARIEAAGITGHWNDEGAFHEFVANDGAVLNWWPGTSAVTIAGKPESRPVLEALFGGDNAT
ncbi:MAG: hypothetical protein AAEJ52_12345 [Myxococcota bacterium]